ncbi:WD40-like beta propeller repeat protein [Terriglobus roseus DSM 18391]|uniref:WD40-like beta propeller repeat protein n=1 Tax=Terriglobus roseus (strain DSM 18391 / NRRL B-41598 / KBS 63) TaxID=926566 RepID=I3ZIV5_TERRK|nr:PD40 domain-containing protein [Terriglobus roseus]AFL89173.1 WD40-like beta propeller repeat protein [Terriglobus roseus DSM 18391]
MITARRSPFRLNLYLLLLASLAIVAGCGDSAKSTPAAAAPGISSLSPATITAGAASFSLTVTGSGFVSGSAVQWNGSGRTTTYTSPTQLSAAIAASDVAAAGTAQIVIANPDGQKSSASTFTVNATLPLPTVTTLSPASAAAGSSGFTLTVNGTGYRQGSQVVWNGSRIVTTTVVSATQVTAVIPASFLATPGSAAVAVANTDTGDTSSTLAFTITSARPVLTSLSPATATAGSAAVTLTVNGTGFISGATVAWAGSARPTTFVSPTQLSAAVPASDLASAGLTNVDVVQAGVRSTNQLPFTVVATAPSLASLSPTSVRAGSAGFDLTVIGTGFTAGAAVSFNGGTKPTTFVSATQLRAAITTGDLAAAGSVTVSVIQGTAPASNTLSFTVTPAAPVISSLSPTGVVAGAPATTLTVNGSGFSASSVVKWNGTALTTTVRNGTLLEAAVPAANLTSAATISITVENPSNEGGLSNAVTFAVSAPVSGKIVQLLSTSYNGGNSNVNQGNSPPNLSQDGRYVTFASYATDIFAGDTNRQTDGFLRDTCVGSAPAGCVPSIARITQDPETFYLNGAYRYLVLSSNARYALFEATDFRRIDLRDNCIGASACSPSVTHINYIPGDPNLATPSSCCSALSPDGRYIVFSALVTNPDNTSSRAIFVRDTCTGVAGCTPSSTRVALGSGATPPRQPFQSDISSGGRYILFRTAGNDIIPTYSTALHLFLQDTCIGAPTGCTITYTAMDVRADGTEGDGNLANEALASEEPSFSKDGRYVVFSSTDSHMIAGSVSTNTPRVYVRDTCVGAPSGCVPSTTLATDPAATSRSFIGFRSISEHGRYVVYIQEGRNSAGAFTETPMVRDTCLGAPAGCSPSTSKASADPDNVVGATQLVFIYPSISADGHYVAFMGGGQVYLAQTGY